MLLISYFRFIWMIVLFTYLEMIFLLLNCKLRIAITRKLPIFVR